jgi:hypothetical protein
MSIAGGMVYQRCFVLPNRAHQETKCDMEIHASGNVSLFASRYLVLIRGVLG